MGFTEKTNYLLETKSLLKDRINSLGGSITSGTTFRDYLVWLDSLYEALDEKTITGLPDSLEGNITQATTQTGKNLFKTPANATSNGITLTNNSDGSITLNGTATANASFTSTTGLNISTGTYTLSYTSNQTIANEKIQLATRESGGTRQVWRWVNQTSGNSTSTTTGVIDYIQILVMSGTTLNNYNIKIQLETGSQATSFEPFIPNSPSPDYPQPINITTGRQVVSVCGKNLANTNNIYLGKSINSNDGTLFNLNTRTTLYQIQIKPNTSYYVSLNSNYYIGNLVYYKEDKSFLITQSSSWSSTRSFTTPSNAYYISFAMKKTDDTAMSSSDIDNLHLQLELGNQQTTYEEYKGNDYEINLGKNLYYMNYTDFSHTWNSLTITSTTTGYSISNTATGGGDYTLVNRYMTLPAGTYTMVLENASSMVVGLSKNNYASILRIPIGSTSGTFTLSEETKVCLTLRVVNGTTYDETNNIMIEKGSTGSSYAPYKTPIYLGKIGTYQDYIFKNTTENPLYDSNLEEGQWYIHKEIGKRVLKGNESNWMTQQQTGFYRYGLNMSDATFNSSLSNEIIIKSDYFRGITFNNRNSDLDETIYLVTNNAQHQFFINTHTYSTIDSFKTWLSSHNVEVYYILNTPTNTLIEDEELINQLNEIDIFTVISEDFYN